MEVPVGVAGPLDVERLAVIETEANLLPHQLVDDGAVVNATNRVQPAGLAIGETTKPPATRRGCRGNRLDVSDVDDLDTEPISRDMEVGQGFLAGRIDVDKDDGLGIVSGDDGTAEELPEASLVEPAQKIPK